MDKYLSMIPKNTLAFIAIVGGILFIVFSEPPHTICDSQIEVFKEEQKKFLYKDPKLKKVKTTRYETLIEHCKATNSPGGCYELFQDLRIFLHDLGTVPSECADAVSSLSEVKRALWDPMELLVQLGWGEKPPTAYHAKFGWLDTADLSLYCKMKGRIMSVYGEPAWNNFRERMMRDLPGAKDLPRNTVWDMSLFSENCARYP